MVTVTPKTAARYLVGRTVAKVEVVECEDTSGGRVWSVERLHFTDGSQICFSVSELPSEYAVTAKRWRRWP